MRHQCEISIGCDEGRFISPEECALAPSFSSPKESRRALPEAEEIKTFT